MIGSGVYYMCIYCPSHFARLLRHPKTNWDSLTSRTVTHKAHVHTVGRRSFLALTRSSPPLFGARICIHGEDTHTGLSFSIVPFWTRDWTRERRREKLGIGYLAAHNWQGQRIQKERRYNRIGKTFSFGCVAYFIFISSVSSISLSRTVWFFRFSLSAVYVYL